MPTPIVEKQFVKWALCSQSTYKTLKDGGHIDANTMYCLRSGEIFRGTVPFTEALSFVNEFPTSPAVGRIYVLNSTGEGKVWKGTVWTTVIAPLSIATLDPGNNSMPVTGNVVAEYVKNNADTIELKWNEVDRSVTFARTRKGETLAFDTKTVTLTQLASKIQYNQTTRKMELLDVMGNAISATTLDITGVIKSGHFDAVTNELVLVLGDASEIRIPAGALIKTFTGINTTTNTTTITDDGNVSVNAIISPDANNALVAKPNGLYATPTDLSNVMNKVLKEYKSQIIVADVNGNSSASKKYLGGSMLSDTPNESTMATEKAVSTFVTAIKNTLEQAIATKTDSSKIVTVINATTPATDKVVSEKALVDSLSWDVYDDVPPTPPAPPPAPPTPPVTPPVV